MVRQRGFATDWPSDLTRMDNDVYHHMNNNMYMFL